MRLAGLKAAGGRSVRPPVQPLSRPPSLTEAATAQLRELIVAGALPAGYPLTEQTLAGILRVSKTPVREALAQLRTEGLVTILPHRGTFVFTPDAAEVAPICTHWSTLASTALRLAVACDRTALAGDLRRLAGDIARACEREDVAAVVQGEGALQAALFARCGNPFLADAHRLIAAKVMAMRVSVGRLERPFASVRQDAEALAAAVEAGQADRAVELLTSHIERIALFLIDALATAADGSEAGTPSFVAALMTCFGEDGMITFLQEASVYLM